MSLMAPVRSSKLPRARKSSKEFRIGTTGWSVADLDDPTIERQFINGRYEIVDGVLTEMPAAYFHGGYALNRLTRIVEAHLLKTDPDAMLVTEVDLILGPRRFVVADALYLNPRQLKAQLQRHASTQHRKNKPFGRIVVPPELLIESMSPGHEAHDRETKRGWYGEFGVQNYWYLDAMKKSLECLRLVKGTMVADCAGSRDAILKPTSYPGLIIPLQRLWI